VLIFSGAKLSKKLRGIEFNNIKFFNFPFTTSSCVAKVPFDRTQKSEKLVQMRSNADDQLSVPTVVGTVYWGRE